MGQVAATAASWVPNDECAHLLSVFWVSGFGFLGVMMGVDFSTVVRDGSLNERQIFDIKAKMGFSAHHSSVSCSSVNNNRNSLKCSVSGLFKLVVWNPT